jgi:hypothetical protein
MIQIKNKIGSDVSISYDGTSEVIEDNLLIDVETLGCCRSMQGLARVIALILKEDFYIYEDNYKLSAEGHYLLNKRYNFLFNY